MAPADSTGTLYAFLNLPGDATGTTIESKTNFLRSVCGALSTRDRDR
jgi:acyl-coenzyme A thioesterase PaaI-like protein